MAEEVLTQEKYIDFKNVKVNDHLVLSITESSKTVDQIKAAEKVSKIIFTTLTYIFIVALALLVIFPFYWMIITSNNLRCIRIRKITVQRPWDFILSLLSHNDDSWWNDGYF